MLMENVQYRRKLNDEQLLVLEWLYRVRFSTSKQIARRLQKGDKKAIQNRLQRLEAQQLIGKRYDKTYKLAGRPAEYYLTPNGARTLSKFSDMSIHDLVKKALYKNKSITDTFLRHCLIIVNAMQDLQALYGGPLRLFTNADMIPYESFPTWRPDLYLSLGRTAPRRFFFDVFDDSKPFFISVRKMHNYIRDEEEGDWPDDTAYPYILAVCQTTKIQTKLNRQIQKALQDSYNENVVFATTTFELMQTAKEATDKIWSKIDADYAATLLSLKDLYS